MSLELFNSKMIETANAIRGKLGTNNKMTVNQFPVNVNNIDIYQNELPEILDPVKVRAETRPADWMAMPETVNENEVYMLFFIPTGIKNLLSFNVTTTDNSAYTVQLGNMVNGSFVSKYSYNINSDVNYEGELTGPDYSDNPITSNGFRQVMIKITGKIKTFEPTPHSSKGDNRSGWNIIEISCNIPNCTSFKCGNLRATRALRNLVYFTKYGLSSITSFNSMFSYCSNLISVIGIIGGPQVTNCENMFYMCSALTAIPYFDTSRVECINGMFENCYNLKRIPELTFPNAINSYSMFKNCKNLVSIHDLQMILNNDYEDFFSGCHNLIEIGTLHCENVNYFVSTFADCWKLTVPPTIVGQKMKSIEYAFQNCYSLQSLGDFDISEVSSMEGAFENCEALESIPTLNMDVVHYLIGTFKNCTSLKAIKFIGTPNWGSVWGAFEGCRSLETVEGFKINDDYDEDVDYLFTNCISLTSLPELNFSKVNNILRTFENCNSLISIERIKLNNITMRKNSGTNYQRPDNYSYIFKSCYSLSRILFDPTQTGWEGIDIDLTDCSIGYQSMLDLFNSLPTLTKTKTINLKIKGNRGAVNLTATDKAIATNKGWTLDV